MNYFERFDFPQRAGTRTAEQISGHDFTGIARENSESGHISALFSAKYVHFLLLMTP